MKPGSVQQPDQTVRDITRSLRSAYTTLRRRSVWASGVLGTAVILLLFVLYMVSESGTYLDPSIKTGAIIAILISGIFSGTVLYMKRYRRTFNQFYTDFFNANHFKGLHSAVDLYLNPEQHSSRFYASAIRANLAGYDETEFRGSLQKFISESRGSIYLRRSSILFAVGAFAAGFTGFSNGDALQRSVQFWSGFEKPNPYLFTVIPADTTIEHGSAVQPGIQFHNSDSPDQLYLAFKTDVEEDFRSRPLRQAQSTEQSIFLADELELTADITYRIDMDGFSSPEYRITVEMQPRFDQLAAAVSPPSYTGLQDAEYSYPFTGITLYRGSVIRLEATPNKPLTIAEIRVNGSWQKLDLNSGTERELYYTFEIHATENDTLEFRLADSEGLENRNRFRTVLNIREDQFPAVSIQEPTGTVMITEPDRQMLFYQATDDFGLTRAELRWELNRAFVDEPVTGAVQLERPGNGRTESYNWDLSELELRPRDELRFRVRVWDNDGFTGAKWSDSQPVTINVPSLADFFDELDSRERDVQGDMDEVTDNFDQMENEYRELIERLRENPDGGFEEQQMMEDIQERRQQIEESVSEMSSRFEQLRSEMNRSDRVSEETQRAYRELQQLIDELDDPSLREAMEQMQKALENMSPQEIERALENMDFNEKLYRERLQRTAELFKRLKMNSDLDKLAGRYEELAERTEPRDDQTLNQLGEELQTIDEDLDSLDEQLEQLDSNPPRNAADRLRRIKEESKNALESIRQQVDELGRDASEQADQQESGESQPDEEMRDMQEQISRSMQNEADRFRSSVEQMSGQQMQVNILALQQALYTLFELSSSQEYLTQTAAETRTRSQGFVELARVQKNVSDQFTRVADTIFSVSAQIPGVPNRVNQKKAEVEQILGRSLNEMVERNQRGSAITSREALGGINDLTSMMASLIDQLMNMQGGGGGSGGMSMEQLVEQLRQMSGEQMQLNQQLQDLINDIQGERLTRENSERLDQLARQQNEIRRQLRDLQQRGALEPGDRALSDLERMIEDMEESINEMRGGITDPLMVERQQNILSRMLETEQSLQQRGESEEREGTATTQYDRTLPPEMTLEELEQEIRSRLQDPNYTRFSEQYRRLIERYFELLRRREEPR